MIKTIKTVFVVTLVSGGQFYNFATTSEKDACEKYFLGLKDVLTEDGFSEFCAVNKEDLDLNFENPCLEDLHEMYNEYVKAIDGCREIKDFANSKSFMRIKSISVRDNATDVVHSCFRVKQDGEFHFVNIGVFPDKRASYAYVDAKLLEVEGDRTNLFKHKNGKFYHNRLKIHSLK